MLGYLLDVYKLKIYNMQKLNIDQIRKKDIILLILSIISLAIGGIVWFIVPIQLIIFSNIITVSSMISIILCSKTMVRDGITDYQGNLKSYSHKLNELKNILDEKRFNLCNKKKIEILIQNCDDRLKEKDLFYKLLNPTIKFIMTVLFPIITFAIGISLKGLESKLIIRYSSLGVNLLVQSLGIFMIAYPFVERTIYKDRYIIKSLRTHLNDIIIRDYSNI